MAVKTDRSVPGSRIVEYRQAAKLSQRALAELCDPPMDFTAIGRIERNLGYSSSTLNRIAVALGCEVSDFFLPDELVRWKTLPAAIRQNIIGLINSYDDIAKSS